MHECSKWSGLSNKHLKILNSCSPARRNEVICPWCTPPFDPSLLEMISGFRWWMGMLQYWTENEVKNLVKSEILAKSLLQQTRNSNSLKWSVCSTNLSHPSQGVEVWILSPSRCNLFIFASLRLAGMLAVIKVLLSLSLFHFQWEFTFYFRGFIKIGSLCLNCSLHLSWVNMLYLLMFGPV